MFYIKVAQKILSKFTRNLIKRENRVQVYFCEFSEILKKAILQNTCKRPALDFAHSCMSYSIIHFIKKNRKKGNYFLNVFNRISTSEKKEIIWFENATFCYIFRVALLEIIHLGMGAGLKWMNEWNIYFEQDAN